MKDLEAAIPADQPAEETLGFAIALALDTIPVIGPMASRTLDHAMAVRTRQRRLDFDRAVVRAIEEVAEDLNGRPTVTDIGQSDEFLAAYTQASRIATETASEGLRGRLAAAVAHSGEWEVNFRARERAQFVRMVADYDDLHIWLLHFFSDASAWLEAHGFGREGRSSGSLLLLAIIGSPLKEPNEGHASEDDEKEFLRQVDQLDAALAEPTDAVDQAVDDLVNAGFVVKPTDPAERRRGHRYVRTTARGKRFLAFLNEPPSVCAHEPGF